MFEEVYSFVEIMRFVEFDLFNNNSEQFFGFLFDVGDKNIYIMFCFLRIVGIMYWFFFDDIWSQQFVEGFFWGEYVVVFVEIIGGFFLYNQVV